MEKSQLLELLDEHKVILIGLGKRLYRGDELPELYNSWDNIKEYNSTFNNSETINIPLQNVLKDKDYFLITTSWDSDIESYLDTDKIYTPAGNCKKLRCYESCTEELWDYNDKIDDKETPRCPNCGADMVMNISVDAFFINKEYLVQENLFHHWLHKHYSNKILIIEWEVLESDKRDIKDPFENIATALPNVTLLRVNSQSLPLPEVIKSGVMLNINPDDFIEMIQ